MKHFEYIELDKIGTLKTLEQLVSEIDSYINESNNYARGYCIVSEYNEFLKEPINLCDFVPCGADGLPLKSPKLINLVRKSPGNFEVYYYNKALKSVVFDSFNIDLSETEEGFIYLTSGSTELIYDIEKEEFYINAEQGDFYKIYTYSDLAKATINKPLKFKQ